MASTSAAAAATAAASVAASVAKKEGLKMIRSLMEFGPHTGSPMMPTKNPFIFCVYHEDNYPAGNGKFGPKGYIPSAAREFFSPGQPWKMYHGDDVPGFPYHPHRGFETITIVMQGVVDHADSLGSAGRYANGDVQWMTAGSGVNHAEMFPLLRTDEPNPMRLFQIWLRLPREKMTVPPAYTMLWNEDIPIVEQSEGKSRAKIVAGSLGKVKAVPPTPNSWAVNGGDVRLFLIEIEPGAQFQLPAPNSSTAISTLWVYDSEGTSKVTLQPDSKDFSGKPEVIPKGHGAELSIPKEGVLISNAVGEGLAKVLLLEGIPIDEPVVQHGPFVATTDAEIRSAFAEYRKTQFGGWPWELSGPVWGDSTRFANYSNGKKEKRDLTWQ